MEPQQAKAKIEASISKLETGNAQETKAEFEFLNNIPHEYARAVEAFRPGLHKPNSDIQTTCALAIGRLGRHTSWAVEELAALMNDKEAIYFSRYSATYALGLLQTPAAVEVLVDAIKFNLKSGQDEDFPMDTAISSLAGSGGLADKHRLLFLELNEKLDEFQKMTFQNSIQAFSHKVRADFTSFRVEGPGRKFLNEEFSRDDLKINNPIAQLQRVDIVYDKYIVICPEKNVDWSNISDEEFQSLPSHMRKRSEIFARVIIASDRSSGKLNVITLMDDYSSHSVINRIEEIANKMAENLETPVASMNWATVTYGMGDDRVYGGMSPVGLEVRDGIAINAQWGHALASAGLTKKDGAEILNYAARHPLMPEGLSEYTAALRADEIVKAVYERERSLSPEGRLHYESRNSEFGEVLRAHLSKGLPFVPSKDREYRDSLDYNPQADATVTDLHFTVNELLDYAVNSQVIEIPEEFFAEARDMFEQAEGQAVARNNFELDALNVGIVLLRHWNAESQSLETVTNVPRTVFGGGLSYEWGYTGQGPGELALNILNLFVPPGTDGFPEKEAHAKYWPPKVRTFCSETARNLSVKFRNEVISEIPKAGGFISAERIKDWILNKLS